MSQVFSRRAQAGIKLAALAVLGAVVLVVAVLLSFGKRDLRLNQAVAQPIAFSHKHHAGDDGIDCRYCHTTVETDAFAGMPDTDTCMSCHSQLYTDAPMLAPLRRAAASGQPLAWNRVYKLPDFVFFNHGIHVAKGVACVACHGRVDQMPLMWRASPLQMQWCLSCHVNPTPHLRPRERLFAMDAPRSSPEEAEQLARALQLETARRLTDCSTCHR